MWHYIKGILIGLLLLWLLLFTCLAISDGIREAWLYSHTLVIVTLGLLQTITRGTGIWIALFIILSTWIWSFGKARRPHPTAAGYAPVGAILESEAQPPVQTEARLGSEQK